MVLGCVGRNPCIAFGCLVHFFRVMENRKKPKEMEPENEKELRNKDSGSGLLIESNNEAVSAVEDDYGYEDIEKEEPPSSEERVRRNVARRGVVKVDEAAYEMSYHPGRVVRQRWLLVAMAFEQREFFFPSRKVSFRLQLAYSPPRQRQKWGDAQSLPHVNWGDLFFDLHYVAATYNISYILVYDPTWEGLLYAAGTFFPVQMIWTRANHRSSRFVTEDDLFHRVLQICTLVVLATAVLHIRPVKYMSNAGGEISMFVFCLCLCLEDLLEAVKSIEEYYFGPVDQWIW